MLNVARVGAGLFVVGITVKTEGTKAQTVAENHRSDVDKEIGQLDLRDEVLRGVRIWAYEQNRVVSGLVSQATPSICSNPSRLTWIDTASGSRAPCSSSRP